MERLSYSHMGAVFMRVRTRATHLNGVRTRTHKLETTSRLAVGAGLAPARVSVRIELWRARIRTGCYQVNGQSLAACILIKEAHFFRL